MKVFIFIYSRQDTLTQSTKQKPEDDFLKTCVVFFLFTESVDKLGADNLALIQCGIWVR